MRRLLLGGGLLIAVALLIALWATHAPDTTSDAASKGAVGATRTTGRTGDSGSTAAGDATGTGTDATSGTGDGSSGSGGKDGSGSSDGTSASGSGTGTGAAPNRSSVGGWSPVGGGAGGPAAETGVTVVKAIPFAITNVVGGLPLPPTGGTPGGTPSSPTTTAPPAAPTTTPPPPTTIIPSNPSAIHVTISPSQAFGGATQTITLTTDSGAPYRFGSCSGSDYLTTSAGFVDAGFTSKLSCGDPATITRTLGSNVVAGVYEFCAPVTNGTTNPTACTPYLVR